MIGSTKYNDVVHSLLLSNYVECILVLSVPVLLVPLVLKEECKRKVQAANGKKKKSKRCNIKR